MSEHDLKKMAQEDRKLYFELMARYKDKKLPEVDKLLGIKLPQTKCFVPPVTCGFMLAHPMSLIPMYEAILLPIYSDYSPIEGGESVRIRENSAFKQAHELTPDELALLAEKGRVIPYFSDEYKYYDEKTIRPLLQPGIPRVSRWSMMLARSVGMNMVAEDRNWKSMRELATKDIESLDFPKGRRMRHSCIFCLSVCYTLGMRKYFQESDFGQQEACLVSYALSADYLGAILKTECPMAKKVLGRVGKLPEGMDIEYILRGLKVSYSPDVPLGDYIDVFDGKTSRAIRKILADLLEDPLSRKYRDRLSGRIYDLNQEVEEIAESRTAKLIQAISDMVLYGGNKFIESQTQRYIKIPKKGLIRLGEWLASRGVDLAAKTQRKDWSVAQLYKARCKLKKLD